MSQTWTEFMATVDEHLSVEANRRGLETFRERTMRNAAVDLQRYIRAYQTGHTTTYAAADLEEREYAMVGNLPATAIPHAFYIYSNELDSDDVAHPNCMRNRLDFWPWMNRQQLICCPCEPLLYAYSVSPQGRSFVIHPILNADTRLLLVWQGLRIDFAGGDTVPFPEESAEAVAAYVKWRILLEIDKNPGLAATQNEIYRQLRSSLYLDERIKLDADKPDEEYISNVTPAPANFSGFGAQSIPLLTTVTMLEGVTTAALAALATESITVPTAVIIIIGGLQQLWTLTAGTDATDTANGVLRPNDYDGATNAKVWYQGTI